MRPGTRVKLSTAIPLALAAVSCLATLIAIGWRMKRGFDWTDEAFYVSMPARFVMGDRPFVDELSIGANAGVFLWPFLKVYAAIAGWSGVFAYVRVLYVAFFLGVGATVYALGRSCRLSMPASLLVAITCICFIPYGLPGLSYNTFGAGFCALGVFTSARALVEERGAVRFYRDPFFWSGFALGCSAFSYPPMIVAAGTAGLAVLLLARERLRTFLTFCAGGVAVGVVLSPLFLRAGAGGMRALILYSFGTEAAATMPMSDRIVTAWTQFQQFNPELWKGVAYVGIALLATKRAPLLVGLFLPFLPLLVRIPTSLPNASLNYLACFGVYAPLFAIALEKRRLGLVLVAAVWLPAVADAFAVSIFSSNGARGAGIGMYPGTIVSGLLFALWLEETARRWNWPVLRPLMQLAPLGLVYAVTQYAIADGAVYRDGPLRTLTTKMTSGPYKGLYTTAQRKRWLDLVEADTTRYRTGKRTTFYYDFPVGYLYSSLPPHLPSTWNFPYIPHRTTIESRWLKERSVPGEHIFRFFGAAAPGRDPIDTALAARATQVGTGENYTIWEVKAE